MNNVWGSGASLLSPPNNKHISKWMSFGNSRLCVKEWKFFGLEPNTKTHRPSWLSARTETFYSPWCQERTLTTTERPVATRSPRPFSYSVFFAQKETTIKKRRRRKTNESVCRAHKKSKCGSWKNLQCGSCFLRSKNKVVAKQPIVFCYCVFICFWPSLPSWNIWSWFGHRVPFAFIGNRPSRHVPSSKMNMQWVNAVVWKNGQRKIKKNETRPKLKKPKIPCWV